MAACECVIELSEFNDVPEIFSLNEQLLDSKERLRSIQLLMSKIWGPSGSTARLQGSHDSIWSTKGLSYLRPWCIGAERSRTHMQSSMSKMHEITMFPLVYQFLNVNHILHNVLFFLSSLLKLTFKVCCGYKIG